MSWKGEVEIGIGSGGIGSWNLTLALVQWKWCRLGRRGEERRGEEMREEEVELHLCRVERAWCLCCTCVSSEEILAADFCAERWRWYGVDSCGVLAILGGCNGVLRGTS